MRRPTTEEQEGLRALLARAYKPGESMTGLELLGEAWIDDVLQTPEQTTDDPLLTQGLRLIWELAGAATGSGLIRLDEHEAKARAWVAWLEHVEAVELLIDLDAKDREQRWCRSGCPGNDGYGSCAWYDLFDTPLDGPDILETAGPAAPELCPFRQLGRAVLVRAT